MTHSLEFVLVIASTGPHVCGPECAGVGDYGEGSDAGLSGDFAKVYSCTKIIHIYFY